MSPASWVVTGTSGFLGRHVVDWAAAVGIPIVTAGRRPGDAIPLDLRDGDVAGLPLERWLGEGGCAGVLHLAAMSRMGPCAKDPRAAVRHNGVATRALAAAAARRQVPFWMVSTDLVFSGQSAPYRSDATPSPTSAYGTSKATGERYVLDLGGCVVRLPLLFGRSHDGCHGATDMFHRALREGLPLKLFHNEWRTPLHVADASDMLWRLIAAFEGPSSMLPESEVVAPRAGADRRPTDRSGGEPVFHLGGPERLDRHALWQRFLATRDRREEWGDLQVEAVASAASDRPRDVSLVSDIPAPRRLDAMLQSA